MFTAQCGKAGMETVLVISSVGYWREGCILLSEISDCFAQDSADDLLNWQNTHKQYVDYAANIFFNLFPACTCFFCKLRSGLILSITKQGEHGHRLGPMDTLQFPAREKNSILVMFGGSLYRELGEQVGRWADRALTSSHHCWDFQSGRHAHWIITTEQHADLLLFPTVLWCFLQSGQWNWIGQLQLLPSVCSGFSRTFVRWYR